MRVRVGTSGYSYKEWKGNFYPADLPAAKMLPYYAGHFSTVEINNTFYRMPVPSTMEKWASEVPDGFTFALKAPVWITHMKGLTGSPDGLRTFLEISSTLGSKRGPLLFRLSPKENKDPDKLHDFLSLIPRETKVAIEVRNDDWLADDVYAVLREHDAALCLSDTDEVPDPDALIVSTASWGYLRLRRADYPGDTLSDWARRVQAQSWSDAYVFFKHEDEGKGPVFAKRFLSALR